MAKLTQLIDNEVFQAYATYATVVLLKMMMMSPVTAYFRMTRKVRNREYCLVEQVEICIEIQRYHVFLFTFQILTLFFSFLLPPLMIF